MNRKWSNDLLLLRTQQLSVRHTTENKIGSRENDGGIGKVTFYVGNHGQFDGMVRGIMKELISEGKDVDYSVVLAYIPGQKYEFDLPDQYADTIYPDGLENVPQRFAICKRNDWMIDNSDAVICYVVNHFGGRTHTRKKPDGKENALSILPICSRADR
mgnify:FL=1